MVGEVEVYGNSSGGFGPPPSSLPSSCANRLPTLGAGGMNGYDEEDDDDEAPAAVDEDDEEVE